MVTTAPVFLPSEEKRPPSAEEVQGLLTSYKSYYLAFHSQCADQEGMYFLRFKVPTPQGFDPIIPATAASIINVATDHVDTSNLFIDVPPASPRARARAERLKKFYEGVWANIKTPVKKEAVKQAFLYGISWLKVMWDADRWPDAPVLDEKQDEDAYREKLADFLDRRAIAFPFSLQTVSPRNILWDDARTGPSWVIEFYDRPRADVMWRYPQWSGAGENGTETTQFISWLEYWDDEWVGYMAGSEWVWGPHRHGYGFLPYVPVVPLQSISSSDGPPQERYQGLLQRIKGLLIEEARLVTAYDAILRRYAWVSRTFRGPKVQADAAMASYEEFGAYNWLPPGVEMEAPPPPQPPQELLQMLNIVQTMIEEATFPNVIRGVRPRGVSTGFGISVLAGMGRLVFQGVADGLARAFEQCNSRFAMLVENKARGKVTVHARSEVHSFDQTIGPEDVRGYVENIVRLKAEAPEEQEREALLGLRLFQGGIISKYEAMRRAKVTNPLEEMNQQAAEQLLEMLRPQQAVLAQERMGLLAQLSEAAGLGRGAGGGPLENAGQFLPGLGQLARPGEAGIQQQRVGTRMAQGAREGVFPKGLGGLDILGAALGTAGGGGARMPSGQEVR